MPRRVFISYTSQDPEAMSLMESLAAAFENAGYDVLVDRKRIQPGQTWRDEIYTWLGICDAAVVLLSPSVFGEDNIWVARESAILSWRKALKDRFLLLPVLVAGATIEDLGADHRFACMGLERLQAHTHEEDRTTATSLKSAIGTATFDKSPVDELADKVGAQLTRVDDRGIAAAFAAMSCDLGPVHPFNDARRAPSLALLQNPLRDCVPALQEIVGYSAEAATVRNIIEIIAPSWVDLCAAQWIRSVAQEDRRPVLLLNATRTFAARMYVQRSSGMPPNSGSRVVRVTGIHGEFDVEDLIAEVGEALLKSYQSALLDEEDTERQLEELLKGLRTRGIPAVVVLSELPVRAVEVADALRTRFPDVCLLCLTGESLPDSARCPEDLFRPLLPELHEGQEQAAADDYVLAKSLIPPAP